jgi:5-formyltetrahydrofolate cyclo-ligase
MNTLKVENRKRLKLLLKNCPPDNWDDENLSKNLNTLFISQVENFPNKNIMIGAFAPIEKEPKILGLLTNLNDYICFPSYTAGSDMVFRKSKIEELLMVNDFGTKILCPHQKKKIVNPQIILVPALGFTEQGVRLGRGRGFYDRYLNNFNGLIIGLGFELQIEKELPTDEHDINMNYIVTEKRVIECVEKI